MVPRRSRERVPVPARLVDTPRAPKSGAVTIEEHHIQEVKLGYIDSGAVKVIEIIGVSEKSFEDAVGIAVAKASESVKGITGVEVVSQTARVEDGKVIRYAAACKLAFAVK